MRLATHPVFGAGEERVDAAGQTGWLYRLGPRPDAWEEPRFTLAHGEGQLAEPDILNRIYSELLRHLSLEDRPRRDLKRRGLTDDQIRVAGYRTLGKGRAKALRELIAAGLEHHLPKIPGCFVQERDGKRYWTLAGKGGLLVPVRDPQGRIVALLVRGDDPGKGGKYTYLSSKRRGGAGPGSPVHFPLFAGDKDRIRITEGALKADIATALSGVFSIGLPGVATWRRAAGVLHDLQARTAVLAFDADARTKVNVAQALLSLVEDLHVDVDVQLEVWDLADGKGIDDLLAAGKTPRLLTGDDVLPAAREILKAAAEAAGQHATPADAGSGQPTVLIDTDEFRVNSEVIQALADVKSVPEVYQRGNALVTILRPAVVAGSRISRPEGTPRISLLAAAQLREIMARAVNFLKVVVDGNGEVKLVRAHPPEWCVAGVYARGRWPGIRPLEAVVEAPTLRPDGSVLDVSGWDALTGLLYEPSGDYPPVPASPGQKDATAARDALWDVVEDFPFAAKVDKAVWLAALLTVLARAAVPGPCPLFLFDGNAPGTGKTLLTAVLSCIATGRDISRTAFPETDEELRKLITSVAIAGDRVMLFDNIAAPFGGPGLDAALTGTTWKERILGRSELTPELPLYTVWFGTGNNVTLRGDVRRRVVPCRLESAVEKPEERTGFKHADLLAHVGRHRGELVVAALTILRAYVVAGRPDRKLPPFGSYEPWSALVRSAVHWVTAGLDPCVTRERLRDADPALATLAALMQGWAELPGGTGTGVTVAEAMRYLRDPGQSDKFQTLREALLEWSRTDKLPNPAVIGRKLRGCRNRVVDGMALQGEPGHAGTQRWKVIRAGKNGP
jgi:hypothetical protein